VHLVPSEPPTLFSLDTRREPRNVGARRVHGFNPEVSTGVYLFEVCPSKVEVSARLWCRRDLDPEPAFSLGTVGYTMGMGVKPLV